MKMVFVLFLFFYASSCYGQADTGKLIGTWQLDHMEFLKSTEDSTNIRKDNKGIVVRFEASSHFVTLRIINGKEKVIEKGSYTISADGKFLKQNDTEAEILLLTDREFAMKIGDEVILHLKKQLK